MMKWWVPYLAVFLFLLVGVFIKALSRSGDLKFAPSDWNVGAPAAASGLLLVANTLIDKPLASFTEGYKLQLGMYALLSSATLVTALFVARAMDQASKAPDGNSATRTMQGFVILGPYLSVLLAVLCLGFALTLK